MNGAGVWLLGSAALAARLEMPPLPFSCPGNAHWDGANPHGSWLCEAKWPPKSRTIRYGSTPSGRQGI